MITAVVLSAGMSSRLGTQKQLLEYQGRPLIRSVVETIMCSQVKETIVVVGFGAQDVCKALEGLAIRIVENENYANGQSTSVIKGVNALQADALPGGVLFALGDQPLLKVETINTLIHEFNRFGGIVIPYYQQTPGNPVIFHKKFLSEFQYLTGDVGAKQMIRRYESEIHRVDVDDKGVIFDIDTWEDYQQLLHDVT